MKNGLDLRGKGDGATLAVQIDTVQDSTRSITEGGAGYVSVPSSSTVTNTSGGLTERWRLMVGTVTSGDYPANWSVGTSTGSSVNGGNVCVSAEGAPCPGADTYALQALFISSAPTASCPANNAAVVIGYKYCHAARAFTCQRS